MTGIIGQEQTSLRPVTRTTVHSSLSTVAYGDPSGENLELVVDKDAESGSGRFGRQVATGRTRKNLPPQDHRNYSSCADEIHKFEPQPKHGSNTAIGLTTGRW
jgi:hypothetical protein